MKKPEIQKLEFRIAHGLRATTETLRDLQLVHQGLDTAGEQVVKRSEDRR